FSTLGRAVEFFAVDERALVVAGDGVGRSGLRASAGRENFVLQAIRQSDHAVFPFVRRQKFFAGFFVGPHFFLRLGLCLGAQIVLHFGQDVFLFLFGKRRFAAGKRIPQTTGEQGRVKWNILAFQSLAQTLAHVHSQGITEFFFLCFQSHWRGCRLG